MTQPQIEAYADFRKFLSDWHAWKQRQDPTFSKAEFSRLLGLPNSRGYLTQVLAGRLVTENSADRFVAAMGLAGEQSRLFRILVRCNQATSEEERDLFALHLKHRSAASVSSLKEQALSAWEGLVEHSADPLHRGIVEATRHALGHVRAGLLLLDPAHPTVLRGTWGTDFQHQTVDEHQARVPFDQTLGRLLEHRQSTGQLWQLRQPASIGWHDNLGNRVVVANGWVEGHILQHRDHPKGVLYVDPGLSNAEPNAELREATRFWARLVSGLLVRSA